MPRAAYAVQGVCSLLAAIVVLVAGVVACGAGKAAKKGDPIPVPTPRAAPTAYVGQERRISAIDKMELVAVAVNANVWAQTKLAKEQAMVRQYELDPRFDWTVDYERGIFRAVGPANASSTAQGGAGAR